MGQVGLFWFEMVQVGVERAENSSLAVLVSPYGHLQVSLGQLVPVWVSVWFVLGLFGSGRVGLGCFGLDQDGAGWCGVG